MGELLLIEPYNVKALYLRGKAYNEKGLLDDAARDFEVALKLEP